jgi:hypothetical protein
VRMSNEEILEQSRLWKQSGLSQAEFIAERLNGSITVAYFRYRLHEAKRKALQKPSFIPIKLVERKQEISLILRGGNSLSLEWRGRDLEEVRRFAEAVLSRCGT